MDYFFISSRETETGDLATMGVFADIAPKYFEKNLIVIPVRGKAPAVREWPKYCQKRPENGEYLAWLNSFGGNGISVVCGPSTGICGFDIDTDDDEILNIIKNNLPLSPVAKKGRRGFTSFYRFDFRSLAADGQTSSLTLESKGRPVVDVLLAKHTVLPPSVHPDIGRPYEWLTHQTLLDVDVEDLPEINLADIERTQLALAELHGQGNIAVTGSKTGRNDYLKAVLSRLVASRTPADEVLGILIKEDQLYSGKSPLFEDKHENAGCTHVWANALRFYSSNFHSFAKRNERKGEFVEVPHNALIRRARESLKFENLDRGFYSIDEKGRKQPDYYGLAEYFIYKYKVYTTEGYTYLFDKTHYRAIGDFELGQLVLKHTQRQIKSLSHQQMFIKTLQRMAFGRDRLLHPTDGFINLANGIYNLVEKKLVPHDFKYGFHYCLDYAYKPRAKCHSFLGFLEDTFNGDAETIRLVQEYMAYTLIGGYPFLHRALCFTGSGRNGKSTLIDVIRSLLGHSNVASVSLSKIDDHFQAVNLDGKLANLVEELPVDVIPPEAFKNIISGGQVAMSQKFKDIYFKPINARFIFATNDTPIFKDASAGLHERLVFVDFPNYITEDKRIGNLSQVLMKEIPGILNWVLEKLPMAGSFRLSIPKASKRLKNLYLEESNTVIAWFGDSVRYVDDDASFLSFGQLFDAYRQYCTNGNFRAVSKHTFIKRLKQYLKLEMHDADKKPTISRTALAKGVKRIQFTTRWEI